MNYEMNEYLSVEKKASLEADTNDHDLAIMLGYLCSVFYTIH